MLVVDASVIMKVLTEEVGSDLAVERLAQAPARTAPDWLTVEIASALSKKIRYAGLPMDQAKIALLAVPAIMPDLAPSTRLLPAAITLSVELQHALYDCLYLAVALEAGCDVLTADRKFFTAASLSRYADHVELLV